MLSFQLPVRPDEVHSSGWKLVFNKNQCTVPEITAILQHLKNASQSGDTMSEFISDFYGHHQKRNWSEDVFADDLQILVRKIIARKPSFRAEANEQLKHQYAHKLHDQYYTAIAHSALQTSDSMATFTQFCGQLALTFGSHSPEPEINTASRT